MERLNRMEKTVKKFKTMLFLTLICGIVVCLGFAGVCSTVNSYVGVTHEQFNILACIAVFFGMTAITEVFSLGKMSGMLSEAKSNIADH